VSVRAPAGAAARTRVRRLLAAAELEPPGLPPASVLVVRSLADPLPRRLRPRPGDVRAPAEWEAAVRGALAECWRGAARPLRGPVPAGADAVWFADTAEMIAAFARDACAGDVARWWWQALLKGLPGGPVAAMTSLWAREARHVPAALEHLAAAGDAARVVAALPAAYATRILAAVAAAFEAPALLAAPPPTLADPSVGSDDGDGSPVAREAAARRSDGAATASAEAGEMRERPRSAAAPPWTGFLPAAAVPRTLATEQAALLGAGLMLHRAPLVARSTAFVARFVRWRAEAAHAREAAPELRADVSPARSPSDERRAVPSPERANAGPSIDRTPGAGTDRSVSPDLHPPTRMEDGETERRIESASSPDPHLPAAVAVAGDEPKSGSTGDTASPIAVTGETRAATPGEAEAWGVRVLAPPAEEARAASGACGVFFLVNALRSLGFFRALDEHFALPPVVGGWGWVELVARALLGPRAGGLADDPVWRVLAELDGRAPDELPGGGFVAPGTWTLPGGWIDLFRGSPPPPEPSAPLGVHPPAGLQRFLDLVTPVVGARIRLALAAAGADPDEPLETALLRRLGTVEATRTHVDVRMDMDQATLPVRLSGLDANPGWVPELARVVTFHFA
jgi:hypothetical protein